MHRKIVSDLFGSTLEFHKNGIDTTTILKMQIGIEDVVASGIETNDGAEFDVFLLGDLQCVEFIAEFGHRVGALFNNDFSEVLHH